MGWINLTNGQDPMQALSKLARLLELQLASSSLGDSHYFSMFPATQLSFLLCSTSIFLLCQHELPKISSSLN